MPDDRGSGGGPASSGLGSRTLRGVLWSYASYGLGRVLGLAFTAALARLLVPEQFGVVALAMVFIGLLETVTDLGLSQALVVAKDDQVRGRSQTAFWWTLGIAGAVAATLSLCAPLLARGFDEPALVGVLPALGVALLLRAAGSTHYGLAQRSMAFRARTIAELLDVGVRGLVGVVLAVVGLGVWSLVLGYVAGALAFTIGLWWLVPWRPSWRAEREGIRASIRFGGTLTIVSLLAAVTSNADYLIVGHALGSQELGLYSLGFKLPELVILNVSVVAGRVLFPAFAAVERPALGRAMQRSLHYTLLLCLPLAAGLAVLAEPMTLLLFGEQWRQSAAVMQVLTIYALAVTVGIPAGTVYKSIGRAGMLLWLAAPRALLAVVLLSIFVSDGLLAVAWVQAGVAAGFSVLSMLLASRLLRVPVSSLVRAAGGPVAATAGLILGATLASRPFESSLAAVVAGTTAGGMAYLLGVRLLCWDSVRQLRSFSKRRPGELAGDVVTDEAARGALSSQPGSEVAKQGPPV